MKRTYVHQYHIILDPKPQIATYLDYINPQYFKYNLKVYKK